MTTFRLFLAACAAMCIFGSASAGGIIKSSYFGGDSAGSSRLSVQITQGGLTSLNFNVPNGGRRVAITYSAHCGVEGPVGGFVTIDIEVDGVAVPPTNGQGDAFCSTDATNAIDGLTRATIIATKTLAPGQHTVQVFAQPVGGATGYQLGASALLIQN